MKPLRRVIFIAAAVAILLHPRHSVAFDLIGDGNGFSANVRSLVFLDNQHPADSTQNPDNTFLKLYRNSATVHIRPDFFLDTEYAGVSLKPRLISTYQWRENGSAAGENDVHNRAFVNEWQIQGKIAHQLFPAFGKQKLLWGSSFFASPSNILFPDTEKRNPKAEVEGKYLATLVYVPTSKITLTALTETGHSENASHEKLKPVQALKVELMGNDYMVGIISYYRENDRFRLGSFGQWTATDGLLLYYDGIITQGTDTLYPAEDRNLPLGGAFTRKNETSGRLFTTVTAGGSYTFLSGTTVSMECLYNGAGYGDAEAADYYLVRRNASVHLSDSGPLGGLSRKTLGESVATGSAFLRKYYAMGQIQSKELWNSLNVTFRYVHSLEGGDGQFVSILEWRVSDRIQFFNINTVAVYSGRQTGFNSITDRSFLAGVEVQF